MTKLIRRLMAAAAAVPLAIGGVASTSAAVSDSAAEQAWHEASERNSIEAYAEFAMLYPDSDYARMAHARLSGAEQVGQAGKDSQNWASMAEEFDEESVPEFTADSIIVV